MQTVSPQQVSESQLSPTWKSVLLPVTGMPMPVELAVERDRIAAAGERSHDHDRLFQRSYSGCGRQAGTPRATISSHSPPAPIPRTTRPREIVDSPVTVRARMGAGRLSRFVMITAPVMLLVA